MFNHLINLEFLDIIINIKSFSLMRSIDEFMEILQDHHKVYLAYQGTLFFIKVPMNLCSSNQIPRE